MKEEPITQQSSSNASLDSSNELSLLEEEENDYVELNEANFMDDAFGIGQLTETLTKNQERPPGEELNESSTEKTNYEDAPTQRRKSTAAEVVQKYKFWDKEFKNERTKIILRFIYNYIYLIAGLCIALCIYWGSYYNRTSRFKRMKMGIYIADQPVGVLPNIVGKTIEYFFTNVTAIQAAGDFQVWNYEKLDEAAKSHNNNITEEVYRQIHHQKVWLGFYVRENATLQWYQALATGQNFNISTSLMELVYETGRDYNAVNNYIITVYQQILRGYYTFIPQSNLVGSMLNTLNETQVNNIMNNAPELVTTIPTFKVVDLLPVQNPVFQAPLQIGLIYLVIFAFFQFIFTIKIHMYIAEKIKGLPYVGYRILSAQFAYLIVSLAFVTLNTAFGLDFTRTFGYSGFLVIWMFGYLTMASLGSIIELLVLLLFVIKPQLIGFLLLFVAVTNLAPTVSPIVLCPDFYRYGYAMPVRNAYDLLHVAYFDAWKGHMGRNIGVLITWIVVSNAVMPFVMKWMAKKKAQRK
ncbi:unnamed protein product [Candida verbasci]|uniref:DUF3533 domain-containing protein n=1 Tax=Candida verbasci TaxID=1227364 RepID=A0A9W4XIS0_9ASCO|nr:unnamed protein product [Candida verbasci]